MSARVKKAVITGVSGQDGTYLARLLLDKGYQVLGTHREGSQNFWRLKELGLTKRMTLVALDTSDGQQINDLLAEHRPDELYNLAGQSSVAVSFEQPLYTTEAIAMSAARLLEAVRKFSPQTKFFQASSAEMFGKPDSDAKFSEDSPFRSLNPYASAKLFAHYLTVNFREAYGTFACSGILFGHESPLRGEEFVTRKLSLGMAKLSLNRNEGPIRLGNLDSRRDWGFAGDYVEAMWRMLQQNEPDDYILATGVASSVRQVAELAACAAGFDLLWRQVGDSEEGIDRSSGRLLVSVCQNQFRLIDSACRLGSAKKAQAKLGWSPDTPIAELVASMVEADVRRLRATTAAGVERI